MRTTQRNFEIVFVSIKIGINPVHHNNKKSFQNTLFKKIIMWSTWPRSNPHRKKFEDPAISRLPVPKPKLTTSQNLRKSEDQIASQSNKVQPFLLIDSLHNTVSKNL